MGHAVTPIMSLMHQFPNHFVKVVKGTTASNGYNNNNASNGAYNNDAFLNAFNPFLGNGLAGGYNIGLNNNNNRNNNNKPVDIAPDEWDECKALLQLQAFRRRQERHLALFHQP